MEVGPRPPAAGGAVAGISGTQEQRLDSATLVPTDRATYWAQQSAYAVAFTTPEYTQSHELAELNELPSVT